MAQRLCGTSAPECLRQQIRCEQAEKEGREAGGEPRQLIFPDLNNPCSERLKALSEPGAEQKKFYREGLGTAIIPKRNEHCGRYM